MRLTQFFTPAHTGRALDQYREVVPTTWSVTHRLDLYRSAETAFASDAPEATKREAFLQIYESLRSDWQVFRPKTSGDCWGSDQIYTTLTNECQPCARQSAPTLTMLTERESRASIEYHLESLGRMKPTARYPVVYPWMTVAKFSHFFNPRLFPIYDTAFMWNKVANGTFKPDYMEFCNRRGFKPGENTARFNLQYTLWAAEIMQDAEEGCMTTFAGWFASQVKGRSDTQDILADVGTYYAAAFEMIAIGAAHL